MVAIRPQSRSKAYETSTSAPNPPVEVDTYYWGTLKEWDAACESFAYPPENPEIIRRRVHARRNKMKLPLEERAELTRSRRFR